MNRTLSSCLGLALLAAGGVAQPPASVADTGQAVPAAEQPPASSAAGVARFSDVVLFDDGAPASGATVVARRADGPPGAPPHVAITDSLGRFTLDSVAPGGYDVRVLHPRARRSFERRVEVGGARAVELIVPTDAQPALRWTILFLVMYAVTILSVRWHHIARSIHVMLVSQLTALATRLDTEVIQDDKRVDSLRETVKDLSKEFDPKNWGRRSRIGEYFFWSRGRENAGWVAIHEVERQIAAFLAPPESVESYLVWVEAQLRVVGSAPAVALADAIRLSLQPPPEGDTRTPQSRENARKALLGRAYSVIYSDRDMRFATLMEWHNKASWLILAALIIIGFLAAAAGNSVLFLAGAAGGFLSRVMRALQREDVPLDYGASWTTLFLSPLFGALAGWFGIAIVALATSDQVNLLGEAFAIIDWNDPTSAYALAVAFLLGFSERFFDAVVGAVERHAAGAEAAEAAAHKASGRGAAAGTSLTWPQGVRDRKRLPEDERDPGAADGVGFEMEFEREPEEPDTPEPASGGAAEDEAEDAEPHDPPDASALAEGEGVSVAPVSDPAGQGAVLDLPRGHIRPVQSVVGHVILAAPAAAATPVALDCDHADFVVSPAEAVIAAGAREAAFELVPLSGAPVARVVVTARLGDMELTGVVEYR